MSLRVAKPGLLTTVQDGGRWGLQHLGVVPCGAMDRVALALPRRATPRTRVPAGSVAVANLQTTVYPFETPGGWSVIGRTPLVLFDPTRADPSLFAPGDRVRFVSISRSDYVRLK